jgi:hypothetical protein
MARWSSIFSRYRLSSLQSRKFNFPIGTVSLDEAQRAQIIAEINEHLILIPQDSTLLEAYPTVEDTSFTVLLVRARLH